MLKIFTNLVLNIPFEVFFVAKRIKCVGKSHNFNKRLCTGELNYVIGAEYISSSQINVFTMTLIFGICSKLFH